MLMWKYVGASKVLVLYVYIDNNNNDNDKNQLLWNEYYRFQSYYISLKKNQIRVNK